MGAVPTSLKPLQPSLIFWILKLANLRYDLASDLAFNIGGYRSLILTLQPDKRTLSSEKQGRAHEVNLNPRDCLNPLLLLKSWRLGSDNSQFSRV